MKTKKWVIATVILFVFLAAGMFAYRRWRAPDSSASRDEMLSWLPDDPSAVWFADLAQFRSSAFLSQLLAWAPQLPVDAEYSQFVQATGFNYERDLDRASIAFSHQPAGNFIYGIAEGRFDQKKIEGYAARSGERLNQAGQNSSPVFALKLKNSAHTTFFTFLRNNRIAWTDDPAYTTFFVHRSGNSRNGEWSEHFSRLAGSSLFGVVHQDSFMAAALAQQAPGGFSSPQLASLVNQLEWITVGAKPDGSILRVVVEGESRSDTVVRQLKDFLSGIFLLAQAGLNGPKNRKDLDPQIRQAYLDLLKSADVEEIDRGSGKSVRVVFEVTTGFLDAVRAASAKTTR